MTKEQAQAKGLVFTGIYERNKETAQTKLEEIRAKGYKAYLVTVPDSPYSRAAIIGKIIGKGWSVYAEIKYANDLHAADLKARIAKHPAILETLKTEYEKNIAQAEKENQERVKWLMEHAYI